MTVRVPINAPPAIKRAVEGLDSFNADERSANTIHCTFPAGLRIIAIPFFEEVTLGIGVRLWLLAIFTCVLPGCGSPSTPTPTQSYATTTPYRTLECALIPEAQLEKITGARLIPLYVGNRFPERTDCSYYLATDNTRRLDITRTTHSSVEEAISSMDSGREQMVDGLPIATNAIIQVRDWIFEEVPNLEDEAFILYETITIDDDKISRGLFYMRKDLYEFSIDYDIFLPTEQDVLEKCRAIAEIMIAGY